MMAFFARGLSAIGGSWLTMPALVLALFIAAHQWKENRDGRLKAEGKSQCDATWLISLQKQQLAAAERTAQQTQQIYQAERLTTESLRHELQNIRTAFAEHRARASSDPSCLSAGVLDALRQHQGTR